MSALRLCCRFSLLANSDPVLPAPQRRFISTDNLCMNAFLDNEHHGARTSALAWVDTAHRREGWVRGKEGETSALVTHPAMPCCTGTRSVPAVHSFPVCMSVCVVEEEWRWEVGRRAHRSKGMLCHMANSLLGLRERSKGRAGTRDKQIKHCEKWIFFYKSFNLPFANIFLKIITGKTPIVATQSQCHPTSIL